MTSENPLRDLGRGIAQLHLKLSRVQETLEASSSPASSDGADIEILFDLLDALDVAIERRPETRRRFWHVRDTSADLWRGLAIASSAARDRLRRLGIEPVAVQGAIDPLQHQVIEVLPCAGGQEAGTLATTHRRGWLRRSGKEYRILRSAQVSAYGEQQ